MSAVPPLDLTALQSDTDLVAPETLLPKVKSFFGRYQLFFYGFVAGVAATIVGSKVRNTLESHSSY